MLVIRREQLNALGREHLRMRQLLFIDSLVERAKWPRENAEKAMEIASYYGLVSEEDWGLIAELCLERGYDWWSREETQWLHEYLSDARVSCVQERLLRAAAESERRKEVARVRIEVVARFQRASAR